MTVEMLAPRDVSATLNYCAPTTSDDQFPYYCAYETPDGVPKSNMLTETRHAVIYDARGRQDLMNLDVTGFTFARWPSVEKEFDNEERIQTAYYAQCEEILKRYVVGAKKVVIYDHLIRKSPKARTVLEGLDPGYAVHVDKIELASERVLMSRLGDDAERLMKGRYRVVNVWRPIGNVVAHDPLAIADFRTFDLERDVLPTRLVYPDREDMTDSFRYYPGHRWYYLSDHAPDEVAIFKCFDSDGGTDGVARFAPHSAFVDGTSSVDAPLRRSIEVRAMVFDTE